MLAELRRSVSRGPAINLGDSEFCLSPAVRALQPRAAARAAGPARPGRRSSSGSRSTPCSAPAPAGLRAQRGNPRHHLLPRAEDLRTGHLGGSGFADPRQRTVQGRRQPQRLPRTSAGKSTEPEQPLLSMPVTCGVPLSANIVTVGYDTVVHEKRIPWPATTGCDQLNFNPSLAAKPSTEAADTASRARHRAQSPAERQPGDPSDTEIKTNTVTLPAGSRSTRRPPTARRPAPTPQAHLGRTTQPNARRTPRSGRLLDSSQLPGPITGGIYLGDPQPGDRYRIIPRRRRLRHPRQVRAPSGPIRAPGS